MKPKNSFYLKFPVFLTNKRFMKTRLPFGAALGNPLNNLKNICLIIGLNLLISFMPLIAQEVSDANKRNAADLSEFAGLPAIFRTPESGLGLGAVFIYTQDTSLTKPSPIISGLMYSEKKQLLWVLGTKQTFDDGRFSLISYGEITKFPQKFYGIGNQVSKTDEELYEERRYLLDFGGEVKIIENLSLGLLAHTRTDRNVKFEGGGKFANNEIPGQDGGQQNGIETFLYWETANDNFYPSRGNKITLAYRKYAKLLGSKYPFDGVKLDARDYRLLAPGTILASNLVVLGSNAGTPFYQMAQLGGNDLLRGYFKGQFRDNKMIVLQSELRRQIVDRWAFALFSGVGSVASDWDSLRSDELKPSYGAGLRFQITPKQKINLRLDVGVGDPKDGPAFYLYVMEAY